MTIARSTLSPATIDQHFIQRAYLQGWSGRDGKVSWARKTSRTGWTLRPRRNPKSVGMLPNYYTAGTEDFGPAFEGDTTQSLGPEWFEAQFKKIEDDGLPVIHRMVQGELPTGQGNRRRAARYLAMSLLRSHGLREWNRERTDMDPERFIPEWATDLPLYAEDQLDAYVHAVARHTEALRPIEMVDPLAVVYAKCQWFLLEAAVGTSFVVGDGFGTRLDNTVRNEPDKHSGMGNSEFLVPISPYRALLLVQGEEARSWSATEDVMEHALADGPDRWRWSPALVLSREAVDLVNLCALAQSREFIFADLDSRIESAFAHATVSSYSRHDLDHGIPLFEPIGFGLRDEGLI